MTDSRGRFKRLSETEAMRALYIDFEGEKDEPPALLGVHRRGRGARPFVQQDILDPSFASLGGRVATLRGAIENVVRRAEHGDRRIVAWSEHELTIVRSLRDEDPELVDRFEARFVNGKLVAQRWRNRCYGGDRPESGKLVDYLRLIDYPLPADAVGGDVGETIRAIRARLDRGLDPTPGQQARWGNLLEHNRHDCAGLRRVCLRATRDLEADGAAA